MWTEEQLKALEVKNKNTIVSAGAGSGKTAVLTSRVFSIIKDGLAKLDEIVVLTFTNAAAQEMRERVRKNLISANMIEEANNVESANITTFDAYALTLVKKYHYYFNLGSDIKIMNESIIKVKEQDIIDEVFDEYYLSQDQVFKDMIKTYCLKNDDVLKTFIKDIISFKELLINEDDLFVNYVKIYKSQERLASYIKEVVNIIHRVYSDAYDQLDILEDMNLIDSMKEKLNQVLDTNNYQEIYDIIKDFKFVTIRNLSEEDKANKDFIKNHVVLFNKKVLALGDKNQIEERFFSKENLTYETKLIEIAQIVDKRLKEYKNSNNAFDFADIAKMALELVKKEEISKEIKDKIKYIMIDEYQDTSDIQDAFISFISHDNVYMVGDTKQSIYRFRNANCEIFQSKYDNYKSGEQGYKVDLSNNFRSRKEIIDDINDIYSLIMNPSFGGVDYIRDHIINSGNLDYEEKGKASQDFNIEIYDYEGEDDKIEKEARIVANDIIEKINEGYLVYDAKNQEMRRCSFKDFAILDASKASFDTYQKVFDSVGIPLKVYKEELIGSSQVGYLISNIMDILYGIKHSLIDVKFTHAYLAFVRSFILRYDDQKIHDLVINNKITQDETFLRINQIYSLNKNEPIHILISAILDEFEVYQKVLSLGNVEGNISNLDSLIDTIKELADLGLGLDDVYAYFKKLSQMKLEIKNENNEEPGNSVRIMSIHKSKGLEFSIVYLPSLYKRFNLADARLTFTKSIKYGLIMPLINIENEDSVSITRFLARENEVQETISERIRLFYVAMTRAKEKLILIENKDKVKQGVFLSKCNSFQDFLSYLYQKSLDLNKIDKSPSPMGQLISPSIETKDYKLELLTSDLKVDNKEKTHQRASKTSLKPVDESLLDLGNRLHLLMESVDIKNKDCSFINSSSLKEKIENVLKLDIFDVPKDALVYKEFAYYDEEIDTEGIIDLLIMYEDKAIIIDYKASNINDEAYHKQLNVYGNYIYERFNIVPKLYLCSLFKAEYIEVPFVNKKIMVD